MKCSNKSVVYVSTSPFPNGFAATNHIIFHARGLLAAGVNCECITVNRTESLENIKNDTATGNHKGISFSYIGKKTIRAKNRYKAKLYDLIDGLLTVAFCFKKAHKNVSFIIFGPSFLLSLGCIIAVKMKKGKIYIELGEDPYDVSRSKMEFISSFLEIHLLYRLYSGFIGISENLIDFAKRYASKKARFIKIPIMLDAELFDTSKKVDKKLYIYNAGSNSENKDGMISTLTAFGEALPFIDKNIDFYLSGPKSPVHDDLIGIIEKYKMQDRVHILGVISYEEVVKYQEEAALAIINKNDNLQNRYCFATKMGNIFASETAVITTTVGEANNYLKDGVNAYIVEPHNPLLIRDKIIQAFKNPDERTRIAKGGKQMAFKEFDYLYHGKRLAVFLCNSND